MLKSWHYIIHRTFIHYINTLQAVTKSTAIPLLAFIIMLNLFEYTYNWEIITNTYIFGMYYEIDSYSLYYILMHSIIRKLIIHSSNCFIKHIKIYKIAHRKWNFPDSNCQKILTDLTAFASKEKQPNVCIHFF